MKYLQKYQWWCYGTVDSDASTHANTGRQQLVSQVNQFRLACHREDELQTHFYFQRKRHINIFPSRRVLDTVSISFNKTSLSFWYKSGSRLRERDDMSPFCRLTRWRLWSNKFDDRYEHSTLSDEIFFRQCEGWQSKTRWTTKVYTSCNWLFGILSVITPLLHDSHSQHCAVVLPFSIFSSTSSGCRWYRISFGAQ